MIDHSILINENVSENTVFQQILDSLNELFFLYDEDLQILWTNKASADSLGLSKEELIGKHCYELWGGQNKPCPDCPVLKAISTRRPQSIEKKTPDGRYWTLYGSVVFNDDDSIQYLVELGLDITNKKKIEIELQKNKNKLENLIESSTEFIWQVDKNGVYTYVSGSAEKLIGYKKSEIIGKTPFNFMESSEAERVGAIFSKIIQNTERINHLEDTMIHKNGHHVSFETNGIPLFDDKGVFNGYFGICRDITMKKQVEQSLLCF